MKSSATRLSGVRHISDMPWAEDHRGGFGRLFCSSTFAAAGHPFSVRQINLSRTMTRGALRGMHFQYGAAAEDKLVRCLRGRIFDVAVDLRAGSPTYSQWFGIELSEDRPDALLIPKGCAHGFQALSADVEMLYLMSADYDLQQEGGLHHACPDINIDWPLPIADLSARDANLPGLRDLSPIVLP